MPWSCVIHHSSLGSTQRLTCGVLMMRRVKTDRAALVPGSQSSASGCRWFAAPKVTAHFISANSDSLSRHSPTSICYHGHDTQSRDSPPCSAGLRPRPSWLISRSLNRVNFVRRGRRSLGGGSSAWWPTSAAKLKYSSPEPHASQTPAGAAVLLSDHGGFPRAATTIMGLWKWALTPIHAATGSSIELVYSSKLVFLCSKYAHFYFLKGMQNSNIKEFTWRTRSMYDEHVYQMPDSCY